MSGTHQQKVSENNQTVSLAAREIQIISLVMAGYNNKDLARKLGISENTAKTCLTRIFRKVGASNRVELALIVLHRRMLDEVTVPLA